MHRRLRSDRLIERVQAQMQQYRSVRADSVQLAAGLSEEDQCVQSMPDASPTKWHLAHTTWFFETVVLQAHLPRYRPFDPQFTYLFNSYYEALGPRHPRPQRGLLTRPTLADIHAYRSHVDAAIEALVFATPAHGDMKTEAIMGLLELGLHHEQQHQELLLTDILHLFSCNPMLPAYGTLPRTGPIAPPTADLQWLSLPGGTLEFGKGANTGAVAFNGHFAFDNETPRHTRLLGPYQLASRPVNCGEYLQFVEGGGYNQPDWWLSDGWTAVRSQGWSAPAYWLAPGDPRCPSDQWQVFGLQGVQPLDPLLPVSQLSFYEADAYAQWFGARLPTEFEWEAAFQAPGIRDMLGTVWQWTRSSYEPYPGFHPLTGAVREYNGKFMVGQQVLRGSSVATPHGHSRATYRNFFPPAARWQFAGLRLAKDIE